MSALDIIYIAIMVVSLAISSLRGGIREAFSLAAVIVGFLLASNFYELGTGLLFRLTSHEDINNIISFLAIFLVTAALISYIGGQLTHIAKKANLGFLNLMAGTAIGTLKGLFVCALLTYALLVLMKPGGDMFTDSKAFPIISRITVAVSPIGPRHFREELDAKLGSMEPAGQDVPKEGVAPQGEEKTAPQEKKKGKG